MIYRIVLESGVWCNATLDNPPESVEDAFNYFKAANPYPDDPVASVVELLEAE
jgi:hypothetical protein